MEKSQKFDKNWPHVLYKLKTIECSLDFFCSLQYSEHLDPDEVLEEMNISTAVGDSLIRCDGQHGISTKCLRDRENIFRMQKEAPTVAIKYTAVILSFYVIGLVILWLHFVKQKYGQVCILD